MNDEKRKPAGGNGGQRAGAPCGAVGQSHCNTIDPRRQPTEIIQCERCKTIETITGAECEKRLDTTGNILCGECYARWLRQRRCRR